MGEIPILGETTTDQNKVNEALMDKIAELSIQVNAAQELLARVLYTVAEPVTLLKEELKQDLHPETGINIDEHEDAFIVSLNTYELVEDGQ